MIQPLLSPQHQDTTHLIVSVPEQKMRLQKGKCILATYIISTSKFGLGYLEGSQQTPLGRFCVYKKIGAGASLGEIFLERKATGVIAAQGGDKDLITTRILWLDGLDIENRNTRDRYIYIHGTNQEYLLGCPASHGCIRMNNIDILEMFDRIETNAAVFILNRKFSSHLPT